MSAQEFAERFPLPDDSEALPADELSWEVLVVEEPRLKDLERMVVDICEESKDWHRFCEEIAFRGKRDDGSSIDTRLVKLAGRNAESPKLRSYEAYEVAYDHLYDLFPYCRRCYQHTGPLHPAHPEALEDPQWEDLVAADWRFGALQHDLSRFTDKLVAEILPGWRKQCGDNDEMFIANIRSLFWDVRGEISCRIEDYCVASPSVCSEDGFNQAMTVIYGDFWSRVMEAICDPS